MIKDQERASVMDYLERLAGYNGPHSRHVGLDIVDFAFTPVQQRPPGSGSDGFQKRRARRGGSLSQQLKAVCGVVWQPLAQLIEVQCRLQRTKWLKGKKTGKGFNLPQPDPQQRRCCKTHRLGIQWLSCSKDLTNSLPDIAVI